MDILLKRAYERPARSDEQGVLVDRLWPRGLKKEDTHIANWMKELAPSTELREWFAHDPSRWAGFRRRYIRELHRNSAEVMRLAEMAENGLVTLVFAAKDEEHNNAVVLRDYLATELRVQAATTFREP
jgi:uncharacterized protein YeaO (DUF488 family)